MEEELQRLTAYSYETWCREKDDVGPEVVAHLPGLSVRDLVFWRGTSRCRIAGLRTSSSPSCTSTITGAALNLGRFRVGHRHRHPHQAMAYTPLLRPRRSAIPHAHMPGGAPDMPRTKASPRECRCSCPATRPQGSHLQGSSPPRYHRASARRIWKRLTEEGGLALWNH
jgi:hypothetical protein